MSKLDKSLQMAKYLDNYGSLLARKQFELMSDYYFDDFSLSEVAEKYGISRQAVLDGIQKAESKLKNLEASLHLCELKDKVSELCSFCTQNELTQEIKRILEE